MSSQNNWSFIDTMETSTVNTHSASEYSNAKDVNLSYDHVAQHLFGECWVEQGALGV